MAYFGGAEDARTIIAARLAQLAARNAEISDFGEADSKPSSEN
jgi:hypothetical protein